MHKTLNPVHILMGGAITSGRESAFESQEELKSARRRLHRRCAWLLQIHVPAAAAGFRLLTLLAMPGTVDSCFTVAADCPAILKSPLQVALPIE